MSREWKVEAAVEGDLEKTLQGLDANGFEIHGIFPAPDSLKPRFVVVARRDLPEGRKKRSYEAQPVALRASNGCFLRWSGNGQPLLAQSRSAGVAEAFSMIRLEPHYGESIAAFRAGADQWLSIPNEACSAPLTLYGPDIGGWQMFSVLPRGGDRVALRTCRLADGTHKFLALDEERRLTGRLVGIEEAEAFAIEPIGGRQPEDLAVILYW